MLSTNDGDLSVPADIMDTNQNQHNELTEKKEGDLTTLSLSAKKPTVYKVLEPRFLKASKG